MSRGCVRSRAWVWLLPLVGLYACGSPSVSPGDGGSSGTTDDPPVGSSGPGMTSAVEATAVADSSSTAAATTEACALAELGAACMDPQCDCASGQCFVSPLGGVCSECDEEADCEGGTCSFGNPQTMTPAVCSPTRPPSDDCVTDDDCPEGSFCTTIIEVEGILEVTSCSECSGDMGCTDEQLCTPSIDFANAQGFYYCAEPGSVPTNEACNLDGDGSECASGQCAPVSLRGTPIQGLCSPCNEDADCNRGETCTLPELVIVRDALELMPGLCG